MVIPFPSGNYLIMANIVWRANAASNNRGNILNLIARGKKHSKSFLSQHEVIYFRFNAQHCRKKKHIKLHYLRNIHLKLRIKWKGKQNEGFIFQMSNTD